MSKQTSKGVCSFCEGSFAKSGMARHLKSCPKRKVADEDNAGKRGTRVRKMLHVQVVGTHAPMYWMHLEMPAATALSDLDQFLRHTWLECCGHMSLFTIAGTNYASHPAPDSWTDEPEKSMDVAMNKVLRPGDAFGHEYDFGTTTELTLKIVDEREVKNRGRAIQIMARNEMPEIICQVCEKKPATDVCSECVWDRDGEAWLCEDCAQKHACGEDMLLPVVNSPRVGMCAYTGEMDR